MWHSASRTLLATALVVMTVTVQGGAQGEGTAPLVLAARQADRDRVRALLRQNAASATAAEADGATALHWASHHDDVVMAELLLRSGARVNAVNDLGATPLWLASVNGSVAMARLLLDRGANPNLHLVQGETPLMAASRSGSAEVARALLVKGASVDARGPRGQTALMWAIVARNSAVVEVLLAGGADVKARSDVWSQVMAVGPHSRREYNRAIPHGGNTALMFAARVNDLASARLLVAAGGNVSDTDAWGVSATTLAAHSGFRDLVTYLLVSGADANANAAGFTALHAAIMRRDAGMVAALLAHGADPNAPLRTWTPTRRSSDDWHFPPALVGATPFWLAARFSQPDVMRLLATHGADPLFVHRVEYYAGQYAEHRLEATTAIMAAVGMGGGIAWVAPDPAQRATLIQDAIETAIQLGVDVNAANTNGRTALDHAQALRMESVAAFLRRHGATRGKEARQ